MGVQSRTFDIPSLGSSSTANGHPLSSSAGPVGKTQQRIKLTDEERKHVEEMIRNAKSLQEISRLEKEINEGRIPS